MKTDHVKVCFEQRENMLGVLEISSVKSYDENDNEIEDFQNYVGQYYFEENDKLKQRLAKDFGLSQEQIYLNFTDIEYTETPWDD